MFVNKGMFGWTNTSCQSGLGIKLVVSWLMVSWFKISHVMFSLFVWLWLVVNDRKFSAGTVFFSHTNQPAVLLHKPATIRTSQPNRLKILEVIDSTIAMQRPLYPLPTCCSSRDHRGFFFTIQFQLGGICQLVGQQLVGTQLKNNQLGPQLRFSPPINLLPIWILVD